MGQEENDEVASLSARSRPQYHYFYGSTDNGADSVATNEQEQESLIGEELVATDHEEDTPPSSEHDLQHLLITNGNSSKPWFFRAPTQHRSGSPGLYRTMVIILLAAAFSTFLVFLIPHTSEPLPAAQSVYIPFQQVDRADFGDPVEGFIEMDLFHPTLLSDSEPRSFIFPFPTGAFWTNLIVPSPDPKASYPVVVYPYAYKWSDSTLQLSYPSGLRLETKLSIRDSFAPELTMSTAETVSNRFVTKFDPLSVTLRFVATDESKWETSLVQGSPYATMKYLNATPIFTALSIFKSVQCPGDEDENFSDLLEDEEDGGRRLFGVCSIEVSFRFVGCRNLPDHFTLFNSANFLASYKGERASNDNASWGTIYVQNARGRELDNVFF
jgi:hypothetical protein